MIRVAVINNDKLVPAGLQALLAAGDTWNAAGTTPTTIVGTLNRSSPCRATPE
jgi:hypothetical protein